MGAIAPTGPTLDPLLAVRILDLYNVHDFVYNDMNLINFFEEINNFMTQTS